MVVGKHPRTSELMIAMITMVLILVTDDFDDENLRRMLVGRWRVNLTSLSLVDRTIRGLGVCTYLGSSVFRAIWGCSWKGLDTGGGCKLSTIFY